MFLTTASRRAASYRAQIMLWFSGKSNQSFVLNSQAFIDATEYIPAQVSGDIPAQGPFCLCPTNTLIAARHNHRVAQTALRS
jgi:hypothetical protein